MLRKALLLLSGNAVASLLLLVRNLLIARLIPVADYGIAATFAIAMAVVEMVSAFGLQQQIIQAKDGDDPRLQAGLQAFQVMRGVVSGALLFLLAEPFAVFLNMPDLAWAYQVLAVVPVLMALVHFDVHRLSRQMRFGPMILFGTVPALLSLLAAWPLAQVFGDYRVMLAVLVLQASLAMLTSHLVAERRYRLVVDRAILARAIGFGWPLLINNVLLFLVFQGDKLVVGRELGPEALALFALGVTLTLTPTLVMAKSLQDFFLPQLSAARADRARHQRLATVLQELVLLCASGLVLLFALAGAPLILLVLGEKYADLVPLIILFAVLQAVRFMKTGPSVSALSLAETRNAMVANLMRAVTLPFVWYVAASGGDLQTLIWIALVGECLAYGLALAVLKRWANVSLRSTLMPHLCFVAAISLTVSNSVATGALVLAVAALLLAQLWVSGELRAYLGRRLR